MRAFVDTNVLLSASLRGGVPGQVVESGLQGVFEFVVSYQILDEYEEKLREKFAHPAGVANEMRLVVQRRSTVVSIASSPPISRDSDDDDVLGAAAEAGVDVIVTGDKDLLVLGSHRGIDILTPREFLDRLEASTS